MSVEYDKIGPTLFVNGVHLKAAPFVASLPDQQIAVLIGCGMADADAMRFVQILRTATHVTDAIREFAEGK